MRAMMRSRQCGHACRVPGHGARCEVSAARPRRTRTHEKREWQRAAHRDTR